MYHGYKICIGLPRAPKLSEVKGGIPNLRKDASSSLTRVDSILIFQERQTPLTIPHSAPMPALYYNVSFSVAIHYSTVEPVEVRILGMGLRKTDLHFSDVLILANGNPGYCD